MIDSMTGWLLVSDDLGVYLGSEGEWHFWSKANPRNITNALVFQDPLLLHSVLAFYPTPLICRAIPVIADFRIGPQLFATMATCVHAGAEGWLGYGTPCYGPIQ